MRPFQNRNSVITLSLACSMVLLSCQHTERVTLAVDFSQAAHWHYLLGVDINGALRAGDSSRDFSTSLRTYLKGGLLTHDSTAVLFKTGQTVITSNFLSDQDRGNLTRQIDNATLDFSPRDGAFETTDPSLKPFVNVGGWNLLRSFARVMPALPGSPVRVGSTWDRERTFPLETDHGNATGWLYQSFTLDSISAVDSQRCAFLSWRFSYRIQPDKSDAATMLDTLPLKGSGNGSALIGLGSKTLLKAHAAFEVPAEPKSPVKASWQESVHLELVN